MLLTLDIKEMAAPILSKNKQENFAVLQSCNDVELPKVLGKKMDSFVLEIEGTNLHLNKLSSLETKELLDDTKIVIKQFYKFYDILGKANYFSDVILEQKMSYLLKTLYKFESILHKITYKDKNIEKTPEKILTGIAKVNLRTLSKTKH
jgi:hypothetical protein